jgi:predicted deacylase
MRVNRAIMRIRYLYLAVLIIPLILTSIPTVQCDIWDPFHTKEEKIAMWKELWDAHPNTTYTSVGKTYNGIDVWLFTAGNLTGKRVLWDGELHGNEDKGSEILFLIAEWLLESGDPQTTTTLEENYVMFIPIINDRDLRGNGNTEISPYGVDLNRNFATGWSLSDANSDTYSGPYPVSEPETQALRSVFSTYRPMFYVNMHCGAGPYAAHYRWGNQALAEQVIARTKTIAQEMEITPYETRTFGSSGFAIGDAVA